MFVQAIHGQADIPQQNMRKRSQALQSIDTSLLDATQLRRIRIADG